MNSTTTETNSLTADLLKAEYQYLSESFWKNEQTGETRVNLFIGLVTFVLGALASLLADEFVEFNTELQFLIAGSMFSLIVLGMVTLLRILIRNQRTDEYKRGLDHIRQTVKDYNYCEGILLGYYPFSKAVINTSAGHTSHPADTQLSKARKFGGLAHTLAAINSILFGIFIGVLAYCPAGSPGFLIISVLIALFGSLAVQAIYIRKREEMNKARIKEGEFSHAGGIVFRRNNDKVLFLLVQAKNHPDQWVLPKGHIEQDEGHGEAALREVFEETGVRAKILCPAGQLIFTVPEQEQVRAKFYLMEFLFKSSTHETRENTWLPLDKTLEAVVYEDTKILLRQAAALLGIDG